MNTCCLLLDRHRLPEAVATLLLDVKQKLALICSLMSELAGHDGAWPTTGARVPRSRSALRRSPLLDRVGAPPTAQEAELQALHHHRETPAWTFPGKHDRKAAASGATAARRSGLTVPTPQLPTPLQRHGSAPPLLRVAARCRHRSASIAAAQAAYKPVWSRGSRPSHRKLGAAGGQRHAVPSKAAYSGASASISSSAARWQLRCDLGALPPALRVAAATRRHQHVAGPGRHEQISCQTRGASVARVSQPPPGR